MNGGRVEQVGSPQEVYMAPASPFVARFVSKANLIRGRWEDRLFRPEGAEGGAFWTWPGNADAGVWRDEGVYPLRPEQLALSEGGKGLPAEVEHVQYQGRELHCTLRVYSCFCKTCNWDGGWACSQTPQASASHPRAGP